MLPRFIEAEYRVTLARKSLARAHESPAPPSEPPTGSGQKFIGGTGIGAARVRVADVGGEEFEEAHRGALAGSGDERR